MEQYIITIDGGTTNTRCILWDNRRNRVGEERREVGVRNTAIDGNNERLKQAVKECWSASPGITAWAGTGFTGLSPVV